MVENRVRVQKTIFNKKCLLQYPHRYNKFITKPCFVAKINFRIFHCSAITMVENRVWVQKPIFNKKCLLQYPHRYNQFIEESCLVAKSIFKIYTAVRLRWSKTASGSKKPFSTKNVCVNTHIVTTNLLKSRVWLQNQFSKFTLQCDYDGRKPRLGPNNHFQQKMSASIPTSSQQIY